MGLLRRAISRFLSPVYRIMPPVMLYGFRRHDGIPSPGFRKGSTTFIDHPECFKPGRGVYIGHHNYLEASRGLVLGDYCQVTNFVTITTHSSHLAMLLQGPDYGKYGLEGYQTGEVVIGSYTFLGPYSLIAPGSVLGKGTIVTAYAHVKGNYPDFAVLAGNPAKVIGDSREWVRTKSNASEPALQRFEKWLSENSGIE